MARRPASNPAPVPAPTPTPTPLDARWFAPTPAPVTSNPAPAVPGNLAMETRPMSDTQLDLDLDLAPSAAPTEAPAPTASTDTANANASTDVDVNPFATSKGRKVANPVDMSKFDTSRNFLGFADGSNVARTVYVILRDGQDVPKYFLRIGDTNVAYLPMLTTDVERANSWRNIIDAASGETEEELIARLTREAEEEAAREAATRAARVAEQARAVLARQAQLRAALAPKGK